MDLLRTLSAPDMDVKKKALAIALGLVSGRNVEEVVLLLKKELTKTLDQTYEKVRSLCSHDVLRPLSIIAEPRVPSIAHSIYSYLRHKILGGRLQRGTCTYGFPWRQQQHRCCGRHCIRQRGGRALPRLEKQYRREAIADFRRYQEWKGI